MINENYEKLGDSDGFNFIQEQTGIKKEKLMGRYKSQTAFDLEKKVDYNELVHNKQKERKKTKNQHIRIYKDLN